MQTSNDFNWKFHRIGGLDQVTLRTREELCHLGELDPKLWVALSCPASGLEFDARTLELIDADKDGRVRIPEIVVAVEWLCRCLKDPAVILEPGDAFPLSCVDTENEEGARLHATASTILNQPGKIERPESEQTETALALEGPVLTEEVVAEAAKSAANKSLNGDGILPAHEEFGEDVRVFIESALAVMGGVNDASGKPGINIDIARAFIESLRNWKDWKHSIKDVTATLGEDSAAVWDLIQEL